MRLLAVILYCFRFLKVCSEWELVVLHWSETSKQTSCSFIDSAGADVDASLSSSYKSWSEPDAQLNSSSSQPEMQVQIPDDSVFCSFRDQCLSSDGWLNGYNKGGVTVWCREEESRSVQKFKVSNRLISGQFLISSNNSSYIKADLRLVSHQFKQQFRHPGFSQVSLNNESVLRSI